MKRRGSKVGGDDPKASDSNLQTDSSRDNSKQTVDSNGRVLRPQEAF